MIFGIPGEFVIFALTLLGVAIFHHFTLRVAIIGLLAVTLWKLTHGGFDGVAGLPGVFQHLEHEWVILANLFGLLVGFAILARHFEDSHAPALLPKLLPGEWKGAFVLLVIVWVLSTFLDNIAAAIIGGTMARSVFRERVHLGYVAAIVAASNAGGAGSVIGDTTTTMMWIAGISPLAVLHAFIGGFVALMVIGFPASFQQNRHAPMVREVPAGLRIDRPRLFVVFIVIGALISTNIFANLYIEGGVDSFPFLAIAVWSAILLTSFLRRPHWGVVPSAAAGSLFLICLVTTASMMPVERLPTASWQTALGLGFVSSFFDNIPLTALAIKQGGYDWGLLAYAVGYGGSMVWFGSSAGVAIANLFPEARSVTRWVKEGWIVGVAYFVGFFALLWIMGWHPTAGGMGSH